MTNWLALRRCKKHAKAACEHARHVMHFRRDLMSDEEAAQIEAAQRALVEAAAAGDSARVDATSDEMAERLKPHVRSGPFASWKEHVEVFAVAIAVAMGFRTYFLQPFKIPTGSMQPTLFGVHSEATTEPSFIARTHGVNLLMLAIAGERYRVVKAEESGYLSLPMGSDSDPTSVYVTIGGTRHRLPRDAQLSYAPGRYVDRGTVLWSGLVAAGDHVLVNRLAINFRRPSRGDVVVFTTEGIPTLPPGTHYIKRLIGLPNESVTIRPPDIMIDGHVVTDVPGIARVAAQENGGYRLAELTADAILKKSGDDTFKLGSRSYLVLGDNTGNSRDSRYWGHVPEPNLVGSAVFVYWPFTRRWGPIQ